MSLLGSPLALALAFTFLWFYPKKNCRDFTDITTIGTVGNDQKPAELDMMHTFCKKRLKMKVCNTSITTSCSNCD